MVKKTLNSLVFKLYMENWITEHKDVVVFKKSAAIVYITSAGSQSIYWDGWLKVRSPSPEYLCLNSTVSTNRFWVRFLKGYKDRVVTVPIRYQIPTHGLPTFYGVRRFTVVVHLFLSWTATVQSISPHAISLRFILIISSHLRLGPSRQPTQP
jgi:hypothetical protein